MRCLSQSIHGGGRGAYTYGIAQPLLRQPTMVSAARGNKMHVLNRHYIFWEL
jgi:hypothetical protein